MEKVTNGGFLTFLFHADSAWKMPGVTLTVEENDKYNTMYADIRTHLEENLSKFAVGDRPMTELSPCGRHDFRGGLFVMDRK